VPAGPSVLTLHYHDLLARPGRKIAGLMTLTVVRPEDLADRILDTEKHP